MYQNNSTLPIIPGGWYLGMRKVMELHDIFSHRRYVLHFLMSPRQHTNSELDRFLRMQF